MDAATLQSRIYSGYGKAALRIGYSFAIYRPVSTGAVISGPNLLSSINASFTVAGSTFNYNKPGTHKDDLWYGLFDGTTTQVGDYLYNASHGTYFIAAMQDELPILCVKCSHALTVSRPTAPSSFGLQSYSSPSALTVRLTSWPGSLLFDARGRSELASLPMDNPTPFFVIMLPYYAGVDIAPSDIVTDDNAPSRKYIVAASELTALGWRISAQQATA